MGNWSSLAVGDRDRWLHALEEVRLTLECARDGLWTHADDTLNRAVNASLAALSAPAEPHNG